MIAEYLASPEIIRGPDSLVDDLLQIVWKAAETKPELASKLLDERLLQKLYHEENQIALAQWQLNQRFHLTSEDGVRLRLPGGPRESTSVRPEVWKIRNAIDGQFPKSSAIKDAIIEYVEETIQTNPAENKVLSAGKISSQNWIHAKELVLVDLPSSVRQDLAIPYHQLQLLEYLIGARNKLPDVVHLRKLRLFAPYQASGVVQAKNIIHIKSRFDDAHPNARTFMLQGILDSESGLLSDPAYEEKVLKLALGQNYEEPVFREAVRAYLDAAPSSQKGVILGRIFASFAGKRRDAGKVSAGDILYSMGPFGHKMAQIIKANGLGSKEILQSLENAFDLANTPSRSKIFHDIKAAFGEKAARIQVRDLVGAASVNYVVKVDILDEKGRKAGEVAVRQQRDAISGKVENENKIWTGMIERLKTSANAEVRKAARTIEEIRAGTMVTLSPSGSELDPGYERKIYAKANASYAAGTDPETGFRIEVAKPLDDIHGWIKPEMRARLDVYEFIHGVSLDKIADPTLRKALARQIVEAEMKALFEKGVFDPDGHPGNWLVDVKNKRLVRIDYSQLRDASKEEVQAYREIFRDIIVPGMVKKNAKRLAPLFRKTFTITTQIDDKAIVAAIEAAAKSKAFAAAESAIERLFALREGLESHLQENGHPEAQVRLNDTSQAATGSLGRMQAFKKAMGNKEFNKLVLKPFGLDPGKIWFPVVTDKIRQSLVRLDEALSKPFKRDTRPEALAGREPELKQAAMGRPAVKEEPPPASTTSAPDEHSMGPSAPKQDHLVDPAHAAEEMLRQALKMRLCGPGGGS